MFATTAYTFILSFTPNRQMMQKLLAKEYTSNDKGIKKIGQVFLAITHNPN